MFLKLEHVVRISWRTHYLVVLGSTPRVSDLGERDGFCLVLLGLLSTVGHGKMKEDAS